MTTGIYLASGIIGLTQDGGPPKPGTCDDDRNGLQDHLDNCPDDSNADQGDADQDGIGDVCDGACENGLDDDGNGLVDFPEDLGCKAAGDLSESFSCPQRATERVALQLNLNANAATSATPVLSRISILYLNRRVVFEVFDDLRDAVRGLRTIARAVVEVDRFVTAAVDVPRHEVRPAAAAETDLVLERLADLRLVASERAGLAAVLEQIALRPPVRVRLVVDEGLFVTVGVDDSRDQ